MTAIPRAEFRVFGHGIIDIVRARMWNGRTVLQQTRTMPPELYILSRTRAGAGANVKIRGGVLDIKVRIGDTPEGYQIFRPSGKFEFPLAPADLEIIEGHLAMTSASSGAASLSFVDFRNRISAHPELTLVTVEKERFGFVIGKTICEYARVYFNSALLESACVESEEYGAIGPVVESLGLAAFANTNYIQAASRVAGLRVAA